VNYVYAYLTENTARLRKKKQLRMVFAETIAVYMKTARNF
jgi:hypothetical protein